MSTASWSPKQWIRTAPAAPESEEEDASSCSRFEHSGSNHEQLLQAQGQWWTPAARFHLGLQSPLFSIAEGFGRHFWMGQGTVNVIILGMQPKQAPHTPVLEVEILLLSYENGHPMPLFQGRQAGMEPDSTRQL